MSWEREIQSVSQSLVWEGEIPVSQSVYLVEVWDGEIQSVKSVEYVTGCGSLPFYQAAAFPLNAAWPRVVS